MNIKRLYNKGIPKFYSELDNSPVTQGKLFIYLSDLEESSIFNKLLNSMLYSEAVHSFHGRGGCSIVLVIDDNQECIALDICKKVVLELISADTLGYADVNSVFIVFGKLSSVVVDEFIGRLNCIPIYERCDV